MRIKGRYVAQIEIDLDAKWQEYMLPFGEIKKKMVDGELTDKIRDLVFGEIIEDFGTVTVTQQYADIYEVEDDE